MTALIVLERRKPDDVVTVSPDAVFASDDYGSTSTLGLRAGEQLTVREPALRAPAAVEQRCRRGARDRRERLRRGVRRAHEPSGRAARHARHAVLLAPRARRSGTLDRARPAAPDPGRRTTREGSPRSWRRSSRRSRRRPGRPASSRTGTSLLWLYPGAIGAKTGLTFGAGFCVIAVAERGDRRLVSIVLDGDGEPFSDAATLLNFGFDGFTRAHVRRGGRAGRRRARSAEGPFRSSPAPTSGRSSRRPTSTRSSPSSSRARGPPIRPRSGSGSARSRSRRRASPMAARRCSPRASSSHRRLTGPWWARAASAVGGAVLDVVDGLAS